MHPEFLNKYGEQLEYFIKLLAAYYKIDSLTLQAMQLSNRATINKSGLMALCEQTELGYSALLNYAQQPALFPFSANQELNRFARFENLTETQPYHEVSTITLQPENVKLQTANCGLACWNENGDVLTTAFYDVFNRSERGFSLARYDYNDGSWRVHNKLLYGNFLKLKELDCKIVVEHGDSITEIDIADINQLAVIP